MSKKLTKEEIGRFLADLRIDTALTKVINERNKKNHPDLNPVPAKIKREVEKFKKKITEALDEFDPISVTRAV